MVAATSAVKPRGGSSENGRRSRIAECRTVTGERHGYRACRQHVVGDGVLRLGSIGSDASDRFECRIQRKTAGRASSLRQVNKTKELLISQVPRYACNMLWMDCRSLGSPWVERVSLGDRLDSTTTWDVICPGFE